MIVVIDIESRSLCDLKKCGVDRYSRDASTHPMCVCYAVDDGPVQTWLPGEPPPVFPDDAIFVAHNAAFERRMFENLLTPKHAWQPIRLDQWRCTMAKGLSLAYPAGLDAMAGALGLPLQKHAGGQSTLRKCMKRETPPSPIELELIVTYCEQDVTIERMLWDKMGPLSEPEQAIWELNERINDRGVPVDVDLCQRFVTQLSLFRDSLDEEMSQITSGAVQSGRQVKAIIDYLDLAGYPLADLQKDTITRTLSDGSLSSDVRRILEIRQAVSMSSTAKLQTILDRQVDGVIRDCHWYHMANTGRFSGRGVQVQNLPQGYGDEDQVDAVIARIDSGEPVTMQDISKCIRGVICAPKGCQLAICDFAAIEARVLAWLAGQQDVLDAFAEGRPLYKQMASKIYGIPVSQVSGGQRLVGKVAVLGLGYGMGVDRFLDTAASWGAEVDSQLAKRTVSIYRESHPHIVSLWGDVDRVAKNLLSRDRELSVDVGGVLTLEGCRGRLQIELPSGRRINYPGAALQRDGRDAGQISYMHQDLASHKWVRTKTYGAKLVQNATQAMARDLLCHSMKVLDAIGLPIVMHVHDEVVVLAEEPDSEQVLRDVEACMTVPPSWAEGLPLSAKGFLARRYRK